VEILGIDIGGSGIKGATVDVRRGALTAKRCRIPTPQPSVPGAVGKVVAKIAKRFDWKGPIGCTFPAVVKDGVVYTAANVDESWIGIDGGKLLETRIGCPVLLLNDADAAGTAEMQFGAGQNEGGTVFVLTFGTGIGSALFVDGALMPNTEIGHITLRCRGGGSVEAEDYASDRIRKGESLTWREWAGRVNEYLGLLESLFAPDLFILGGGVSKKHGKFIPLLETRARVVPAQLLNEAGIVGAAVAAQVLLEKRQGRER
jgi:polyphosphate glucokinase